MKHVFQASLYAFTVMIVVVIGSKVLFRSDRGGGSASASRAAQEAGAQWERIRSILTDELDGLRAKQADFLREYDQYAQTTAWLGGTTPGVRTEVIEATAAGWSAAAAHPAMPRRSCVLYVGRGVDPPRTAERGRRPPAPDTIVCD